MKPKMEEAENENEREKGGEISQTGVFGKLFKVLLPEGMFGISIT